MNYNRSFKQSIWLVCFLVLTTNVQATATDLSTTPLVTAGDLSVAPNIFLMMDDSGSMDWDYLPDEVDNFVSDAYGRKSSQCNGMYYDPTITYNTPVGMTLPTNTYTAALENGYKAYNATTNPKVDFTKTSAIYYRYSGKETVKDYTNTNSNFYKECNKSTTTTTTLFTKVDLNSTTIIATAADKSNFATWYTYHRIRMNAMKTATGKAFNFLDQNYRVGYATINNNNNSDFINLAPFTGTSKAAWYTKLYATTPNNSTPLRQALSNVGLMYAHKLPNDKLNNVLALDPIEYSCQQNFTLLATDGYWNGNASTSKLDGTSVGNQDNVEPRPQFDGSVTIFSKQSKQYSLTTSQEFVSTVTTTLTSSQLTRTIRQDRTYTASLQKCTSGSCRTNSNNWNSTNSTCTVSGNVYCRYDPNPSVVTNKSCIPVAGSNSPTYTVLNAVTCDTFDTSSPVSTCTPVAKTSTGAETLCSVVTTISNVLPNDSNCSRTSTSGGKTTSCQTVTTTPTAGSCPQSIAASSSNNYVQTACTKSTPETNFSSKCTTAANNTVNGLSTTCNITDLGTTNVSSCVNQVPNSSNNGVEVVCGSAVTTVGAADTLADVADYYYKTDLRDSVNGNCTGFITLDVCDNNVPTTDQDRASWQHMTTYTLGLGATGKMLFSPTYQTDSNGDYHSVANGETASTSVCTWINSGGICNWPAPTANDPSTIDDLWHAAVNGRGQYFSASNTSELSTGLTNALESVQSVVGTSAAATPSNPNVRNGDAYLFSSSYMTQDWTGELIRQQVNINTGVVSRYNPTDKTTYDWAAQALLDNKIYSSRTIYTNSGGSLTLFDATNFGSNPFFTTSVTLSQFCIGSTTCLSTSDQLAAKGTNLINFLRGDRSHEGAASTAFYRVRQHVLGDIVDSETVYVDQPLFHYTDTNYAAHLAAISCRQPIVYVGSDDGMLHAFFATSRPTNTNCSATTAVTPGEEAWAYIPSFVLSKLYKLADKAYSTMHDFYVNGTPVVNEICSSGCGTTSAVWKTILVGGLNEGGRGYYALDITDPTLPKLLWEFSDVNLGYSYGNPMITKLTDGTWVVLVSSGYNNVLPGDGIGHLFVLNANTGVLLKDISTGIGSTSSPSGLAKLNVYATNADVNNTALRAYGGDLLGNLWRFNLDAGTAQLVVKFKDPSGNPQPITTKPELGLVNNIAVVFVGTGQFLGISDLSTTQSQSIYAVKDSLLTPIVTLPSPHASGFTCSTSITTNCFVQQPASSGTINSVNLVNQYGWFVDLPDSGERANTDPALLLGTLVFNTNVPSVTSCTVGGYSEQYQFDYRTGGAINATTNVDLRHRLGNAFANRVVLAVLPTNSIIAISSLSNGLITPTSIPISPISSSMRRLSWRELTN